jgi:hypothetical protein
MRFVLVLFSKAACCTLLHIRLIEPWYASRLLQTSIIFHRKRLFGERFFFLFFYYNTIDRLASVRSHFNWVCSHRTEAIGENCVNESRGGARLRPLRRKHPIKDVRAHRENRRRLKLQWLYACELWTFGSRPRYTGPPYLTLINSCSCSLMKWKKIYLFFSFYYIT